MPRAACSVRPVTGQKLLDYLLSSIFTAMKMMGFPLDLLIHIYSVTEALGRIQSNAEALGRKYSSSRRLIKTN